MSMSSAWMAAGLQGAAHDLGQEMADAGYQVKVAGLADALPRVLRGGVKFPAWGIGGGAASGALGGAGKALGHPVFNAEAAAKARTAHQAATGVPEAARTPQHMADLAAGDDLLKTEARMREHGLFDDAGAPKPVRENMRGYFGVFGPKILGAAATGAGAAGSAELAVQAVRNAKRAKMIDAYAPWAAGVGGGLLGYNLAKD